MTLVEMKRVFGEWRTRLHRVQQVLSPPQWSAEEWLRFSRALYLLVRKYGTTWSEEGITYWDVRWDLREGGELICQIEQEPSVQRRSLLVAQSGGFAKGQEHYTWFYAEFGENGTFVGNPYWVDGSWKDALAMIILPQQMAAGFYLAGGSTAVQPVLLTSATHADTGSVQEEISAR